MPATPPSSSPEPLESPESGDLNLVYNWDDRSFRPEPRRAAVLSVLFHIVLFGLLAVAPKDLFQIARAPQPEAPPPPVRRVTPLVAPPFQLTQKEANKGPIKQEVNLDELRASMKKETTPRAYTPPPSPAQRAEPAPRPIEAPPQIQPTPTDTKELAQLGAPQLPMAPAPQAPPNQKRNPFETIGQASGTPKGVADGRIPTPPKVSMEEMMRQNARASQGSSGQVVGDIADPFPNPTRTPNRTGSSLELLSDPQGVDFRPYMIKVLAIVKRNWLSVIPESANFGRRGKTMIQFSINREGKVPKLVIASPSGTEALDRAAVAGISASVPLPPLPAEFKGDIIRLQFGFTYNQ